VEESISGVRGVLDYAVCFSKAVGCVGMLNGQEVGLSDGLDIVHNPL